MIVDRHAEWEMNPAEPIWQWLTFVTPGLGNPVDPEIEWIAIPH
jgi:hypothetical protein